MSNKEKNKRVIESVNQFYKFNHINSEKYASDQMEAYRENKTYGQIWKKKLAVG